MLPILLLFAQVAHSGTVIPGEVNFTDQQGQEHRRSFDECTITIVDDRTVQILFNTSTETHNVTFSGDQAENFITYFNAPANSYWNYGTANSTELSMRRGSAFSPSFSILQNSEGYEIQNVHALVGSSAISSSTTDLDTPIRIHRNAHIIDFINGTARPRSPIPQVLSQQKLGLRTRGGIVSVYAVAGPPGIHYVVSTELYRLPDWVRVTTNAPLVAFPVPSDALVEPRNLFQYAMWTSTPPPSVFEQAADAGLEIEREDGHRYTFRGVDLISMTGGPVPTLNELPELIRQAYTETILGTELAPASLYVSQTPADVGTIADPPNKVQSFLRKVASVCAWIFRMHRP